MIKRNTAGRFDKYCQEKAMTNNQVSGSDLIAEERARQIEKEGYDQGHDSHHDCNELARAADCYLQHVIGRSWVVGTSGDDYAKEKAPDDWPWDQSDWKPKNPIRDLVRAGALIAAEIDRLQRESGT